MNDSARVVVEAELRDGKGVVVLQISSSVNVVELVFDNPDAEAVAAAISKQVQVARGLEIAAATKKPKRGRPRRVKP